MLNGLIDGLRRRKPRTFSVVLTKPLCPFLPGPPGTKEPDSRIVCALLPAELASTISGVDHLSRVPVGPGYDAYSHIAHDGHKEEHAANDVCAAPGEQGTASAEGDLVPCSWTHPALHTYPHPSVIWTHVPERCKRLIKGHIH